MARKPITVSQLNEYLDKTLRLDPLLNNVLVYGEVTNLKYHESGHVYFSIVDDKGKLNCVAFRNVAQNFNDVISEGDEVVLSGYINIYSKGGSYSLVVRSLEINGVSQSSIAFEKLKQKLLEEGLFSKEHKKPIPSFPLKIAVVTAETGAAVQDILKIVKSRNNLCHVLIFPAQVQGEGASETLVQALNKIEKEHHDIDTVIIGRGGGSQEDLSPFNDETLARKIYDFPIPIISAVGHEIDISISDFVADASAPTPTAAAEMAVPDLTIIRQNILSQFQQLKTHLTKAIEFKELQLENQKNELVYSIKALLDKWKSQIEKNLIILENNNPETILSKGYSVLLDKKDKVITGIEQLQEQVDYKLKFVDGNAKVKVLEVNKDGKK